MSVTSEECIQKFFDERKYSQIPEEFPDREKYPLYYTARKREMIIEPGQKLFIPAGWFHFVFSGEGFNCAISRQYESDWVDDGTSKKEPEIRDHVEEVPEVDPEFKLDVHESKSNFFPSKAVIHKHRDVLNIRTMKYKDFIESNNPHWYLMECKYTESITRLWINFGNVYTALHYDLKDNWLCQIKGTKRILLFPPEDRHLLYLWNPYPLETIHKLIVPFTTDQFIRRSKKSLPPDICARIMENGDMEYLMDERISQLFMIEFNTYIKWLEKTGAACLQSVKKPTEFSRKVPKQPPYPFQMVWALEHGYIRIRNFEWAVEAGEMFVFPLSFVYPWSINCAFLVPDKT